MRIIACLFTFFVLFEGCSFQKKLAQKQKEEVCLTNLRGFIQRNWRYNPVEDFYDLTQAGMDSLKGCVAVEKADTIVAMRYFCLEDITMEQMEASFGKAHEKGTWSLMYYNAPGWKISVHGVGFTKFTFDTPNHTLRCVLIF